MHICLNAPKFGRKFSSRLAALFLALSAVWASAAPLTNGNFESAPNVDGAANTFTSWTETAGGVAVRAATPLTGLVSALLTGNGGQTGSFTQTVDPISGTFDFSFSFAAVNPGGASPSTNDRSLQLLLTGSNGAQINLIITRGSSTTTGTVQLFNGSFQVLTGQADKVNFSTSLSTPVINNISLTGTVGGNYTLTTNGTASTPVAFYQAGNAATPTNFATVNFTTVNAATVNYVVDNVALTPEPATAGLLGGLAVAGLLRRRRRAH